jgi:hypothetical protein
MALPTRTLKEIFALVRQNLSTTKEGKLRLTDNIIWTNANLVLAEAHQIICDGGGDHYEKLSATKTSSENEVVSSALTTLATDLFRLRRIWQYDDTSTPNGIRRMIRGTNEQSDCEFKYEILENKLYWFPQNHEEFKYQLEYLRTPTAPTDLSSTPDIPSYADDFFLTALTARCAIMAGATPDIWFQLASQTRRQLIQHSSNVTPGRQTVYYRVRG